MAREDRIEFRTARARKRAFMQLTAQLPGGASGVLDHFVSWYNGETKTLPPRPKQGPPPS
jgi:hypothetical protein